MKTGDLITARYKGSGRLIWFGILLEKPLPPLYINFPKRYRVLTTNGIEILEGKEWLVVEATNKFKRGST
jgi:hypothetical protein